MNRLCKAATTIAFVGVLFIFGKLKSKEQVNSTSELGDNERMEMYFMMED